jgi:hypothetical protein
MYPTSRPSLPGVTVAGSGGAFPAGAIVFYRISEINANGEGQPSLEGYIKSTSAGSNRLTVLAPTAVDSAVAYNVYASESDTMYALGTGTVCGGAGLCRTSSSAVQVTTSGGNNMYVGETFAITSAATTTFNGVFIVATVLNNTTFTYAQAGILHESATTATISAVLASGTEVLQTGTGTGCTTTKTLTTALPTGQMVACDIGYSWASPSGSPLTTGTVRPPDVNASYALANNSTCSMAGFCQTASGPR